MKRRISVLLLLTAACSVAAASGIGERGGERPRIVMVAPAVQGELAAGLQAGLQAFGKDYPDFDVSMTTPAADGPDAQAKTVQDLAVQRVRAILVVSEDPASLAPAFQQAKAAGIVTLTVGSPQQRQARGDVEPFDDDEYGRHLMDVMATWMGYSGSWQPLVSRRDSAAENRRVDGALAEALAAYPGLKAAVDRLEDAADERVARYRVADLLKAYPEVKAVMAGTAAAVRGAALAVTEAGLVGTVGVFGTCHPSEAADDLRSGAVVAICFWDPADAAYVTARAAYELLRRGTLSSGMDLGRTGYSRVTVKPNAFGVPVITGSAWVTVTRDNLKDWVRPDGSPRL